MKTIFITSFHVFISRNILAAPFLKLLVALPNIRIVLLVPVAKVEFFKKEFAGERVIVEGVKRRLTRLDALLGDFALAATTTRSARIRRSYRIGWIYSYTPRLFLFAPLFFHVYRYIYRLFVPRDTFTKFFLQYKPDLVFATDIFSQLDSRLLLEAMALGVKTVGMVRSWDNLTTKGPIPVFPDLLLVNNEIIRREAIYYHHFQAERIRVVGIPHYDRYGLGPVHGRADFERIVGLPSGKKFFIYAPQGDRFFTRGNSTFDRDIIEIISTSLPDGYILLVRFPPADSVNLDELQLVKNNVFFHRPGTTLSDKHGFYKQNELSSDDEDILIDTLYYSEALISIGTTLAIDSVMFNKPQILIGFTSENRIIVHKSVVHVSEYEHMKSFLFSGGVRIVLTPVELAQSILNYLADLSLNKVGRDRIIREQVFRADGKSSERLFTVIKNELQEEN